MVTKEVGDSECAVTHALLSGNAPSIAKAVLAMDDIREAVTVLLLDSIDGECSALCKKTPASQFRTIPVEDIQHFQWLNLVENLQTSSPLLFRLLTTIAGRSDARNTLKVGPAHYPGICAAAAVILKERNREMCGLQSVVSLLMYNCHCEKQVYTHNIYKINC